MVDVNVAPFLFLWSPCFLSDVQIPERATLHLSPKGFHEYPELLENSPPPSAALPHTHAVQPGAEGRWWVLTFPPLSAGNSGMLFTVPSP